MENFTAKRVLGIFLVLFFLGYGTSVYWGLEPDVMDISELVVKSKDEAAKEGKKLVVGYTTTTTLITVAETLLDKPGGYLSNDVIPPSLLMDNMPAWELGVLEQVRDLSLIMRKDFSRSQSQSMEDKDLKVAQPKFNIDSKSWHLPSAEAEYREAIKAIYSYRTRLADPNQSDAQFYARADNLAAWLKEVQSRLGSLSQKLSSSVGRHAINDGLAGDSAAQQSTYTPEEELIKTSWFLTDDVFYEARGASWALLHFMKAIEVDFKGVLEKKNASVSVRQIIRELEETQETVWSPMILNGSGFGLMANHSLVMANYISRANAAVIDLSELLNKG
ncbi:DUF2333 family protein [Motilimonas sp. 1_MG-2023]|uniref:DUF2333 family protein n=1 Tax=Motilimonas sp. 1_MG-2023 TaxID=3062672 RepID=UPI0026E3E87F|nr:DUF2333 family protein [Motilimonas sp. 1_MG-2023]MDO6524492.1 DUF2333 family protein [Motilimonas sp. 1_MG-2023]